MSTPAFDLSSVLPENTDLAALRGAPTVVHLHNPEAVEMLRYDFDSLAALEEQYGTLQRMSADIAAAVFTHLPHAMAAGLRHTGDPTLSDGVALRRRLDLADVAAYGEAFGAAFVAAFGSLIKETGAAEGGGDEGEAAGAGAPSRGDGGSPQPSSTSDSAPTTSGA